MRVYLGGGDLRENFANSAAIGNLLCVDALHRPNRVQMTRIRICQTRIVQTRAANRRSIRDKCLSFHDHFEVLTPKDRLTKGTCQVKTTAPLFDAGETVARPAREVSRVKVTVSDDRVTGVAGAALWGPLLDRLGVVPEADRRRLREIGSGGYTGGECYRAVVEVILAGGDVISDRSLLAGEAMGQLRSEHRLPSQWTLWRFGAGANLGRVARAGTVNRVMLARAWAARPVTCSRCGPGQATPTPVGP